MNFIKKIQEWRFKKQGLLKNSKYKVDKLIFNAAFLVFLFYLLSILYANDFNFNKNIYVYCDGNEYPKGCENPFYCDSGLCVSGNGLSAKDKQLCTFDWCKSETLPPFFEYGKKYDGSAEKLGLAAILIFAVAGLINHLIHNKGFKLEVNNDDEKDNNNIFI